MSLDSYLFGELSKSIEKLFIKDDWDYKTNTGTIMGRIKTINPRNTVHLAFSLNDDLTLKSYLLHFKERGFELTEYDGFSSLDCIKEIHSKLIVYRSYELSIK